MSCQKSVFLRDKCAKKLFVTICLLLTTCGQLQNRQMLVTKDKRRFTVNLAGEIRTGALKIPQKRQQHSPMIIVLHGMGASGEAMRSRGFDLVAGKCGYFIVYPDGKNGGWSSLNDNAFFEVIIREMYEQYAIDRNKVFMSGHSLGAIQCYESALLLGKKIAGIAAVSGTMSAESAQLLYTINPSRKGINPTPVPVMHIHSLDDDVIPFEGKHLWNIYSVDETIAFWKNINGCTDVYKSYPATMGIEGRIWCGAEADCVLLLRQNGGHAWPATATESIVRFFDTVASGKNRFSKT